MDTAGPAHRHKASQLGANGQVDKVEDGPGVSVDRLDEPPDRNNGDPKSDDRRKIDLRRTVERLERAHGATILQRAEPLANDRTTSAC